jgi:hypothetical protein
MNSSRRLATAIFACLAVMHPNTSRAQIGVESLLGSITDLSISASCWNTRSDFLRSRGECPLHSGWGVEAIFNLGYVRIGKAPPAAPEDTSWVLERRQLGTSDGRVDSLRMYTPKVASKADTLRPNIRMELGLGYGQFTGFESSNPDFEIHGTVRETPTLTLYGTWEPRNSWITPYLGVRTGLIQLHNVQLLQPGTADTVVVYKASSDVFQLGGVFGVSTNSSNFPLAAFIEVGYHVRKFPSVEWATNSSGKIVNDLPHEFDFSGWTLELGIQAHIRDRKE